MTEKARLLGNQSAFPSEMKDVEFNPETGGITIKENCIMHAIGISVREHFAVMAMQGLLNSTNVVNKDSEDMTFYNGAVQYGYNTLAELSIKCADALLEELSKEQS